VNFDGKPIRTPLCSICGQLTVAEFKPFCSARCANIDLSRWLNGGYAIPGGVVDDDEDGDPNVDGLTGKPHQDPADEPDNS
jgi:uncharacterized protein